MIQEALELGTRDIPLAGLRERDERPPDYTNAWNFLTSLTIWYAMRKPPWYTPHRWYSTVRPRSKYSAGLKVVCTNICYIKLTTPNPMKHSWVLGTAEPLKNLHKSLHTQPITLLIHRLTNFSLIAPYTQTP